MAARRRPRTSVSLEAAPESILAFESYVEGIPLVTRHRF